jgi:hypothetical protein
MKRDVLSNSSHAFTVVYRESNVKNVDAAIRRLVLVHPYMDELETVSVLEEVKIISGHMSVTKPRRLIISLYILALQGTVC